MLQTCGVTYIHPLLLTHLTGSVFGEEYQHHDLHVNVKDLRWYRGKTLWMTWRDKNNSLEHWAVLRQTGNKGIERGMKCNKGSQQDSNVGRCSYVVCASNCLATRSGPISMLLNPVESYGLKKCIFLCLDLNILRNYKWLFFCTHVPDHVTSKPEAANSVAPSKTCMVFMTEWTESLWIFFFPKMWEASEGLYACRSTGEVGIKSIVWTFWWSFLMSGDEITCLKFQLWYVWNVFDLSYIHLS